MGISHSEGLAKKRGSKSSGNAPMKTTWFSPQVEAGRAQGTQSCCLPDPPPTTPLSLGKPRHTSLKQKHPGSLVPLLCQRWPSRSGGGRTQRVPVLGAESQRWRWGGGRGSNSWWGQRRRAKHALLSTPAPAMPVVLQQGSPKPARQASTDSLTRRHGRFASPPVIKPLTLRCTIATGSTDAACWVLRCSYFTKRYKQLGQRREITAY